MKINETRGHDDLDDPEEVASVSVKDLPHAKLLEHWGSADKKIDNIVIERDASGQFIVHVEHAPETFVAICDTPQAVFDFLGSSPLAVAARRAASLET